MASSAVGIKGATSYVRFALVCGYIHLYAFIDDNGLYYILLSPGYEIQY